VTEPATVPKNGASEFETLNDGTLIEVTLQDTSVQTVKVRKVPLREMPVLGAAWAREARELLIYCRTPSGAEFENTWLDQLTDEAWEALMKEGRRLNFTRFQNYFARQRQAYLAMGNDLLNKEDLMEKAVQIAKEK